MKIDTQAGKLPPAILNGSIKNQALAGFTRLVQDHVRSGLIMQFQDECWWKPSDIIEMSPVSIPEDRNKQAQQLLWKFEHDDFVWLGPGHDPVAVCGRWISVANLRQLREVAGDFVQTTTIPQESGANGPDLVRRFLVIKTLNRYSDEGAGLFFWLNAMFDLEIVAVVETVLGAYEGWFIPPDEELFKELMAWLTFAELCQVDSFAPFQKALLPGKSARLLYLAE